MKTQLTILALVLTTVTSTYAQDPREIGGPDLQTDRRHEIRLAASLAEAYEQLAPGQTVQLSLADGTTVTAGIAGWDGRRLHLLREGHRDIIDGSDVLALWMRGRATRTGLLAGAVLGGVGGVAFMGLVAYVLDTMDGGGAPLLPLVVGGMAAGVVGGGLLGVGIGSALPDWELIYAVPGADLDRPASGSVAPDAVGRIGSLEILAGAAQNQGVVEQHTDFAWRLGLLADRGDRFSYGVEMGRYMTGPSHRPHQLWPDSDRSSPVWHAGSVAHVNLLAGPVVPYLSGGLAYYNWNDSFLGWSAGAGLRLSLSDGADWICEYRYHANLQRLGETEPKLATILAGVTIAW